MHCTSLGVVVVAVRRVCARVVFDCPVSVVVRVGWQHAIKAPYAAKVASLRFKEGDFVQDNDVLVTLGAKE